MVDGASEASEASEASATDATDATDAAFRSRLTPFSRRTSLGYQVNLLARLFEQALRRRIVVHGVVPGQFPALMALYEQDGRTQAELCRLVRIEQPTMANTLTSFGAENCISKNATRLSLLRRVRGSLVSGWRFCLSASNGAD